MNQLPNVMEAYRALSECGDLQHMRVKALKILTRALDLSGPEAKTAVREAAQALLR